MRIVKIFSLILIALQGASAFAWNPFGSKLQVYKCSNGIDARSCSSSCSSVDGIQMEFKVNVDKSLVTGIYYERGTQTSSVSYQNCKVIDEKNWSCEESSESAISFSNSTNTMTNGRYFGWNYFGLYPNKRRNIKGGSDELFSCAK